MAYRGDLAEGQQVTYYQVNALKFVVRRPAVIVRLTPKRARIRIGDGLSERELTVRYSSIGA